MLPSFLLSSRPEPAAEKELPMSQLNALESENFKAVVLNARRPVVVEFGASWCGPCKTLEPVLVELAEDYTDQVDFFTVDVDQNPNLAMDFGVMSVPTLILFRRGQPVQRVTGAKPKRVLVKKLFKDLFKD
jgi:thioredoxin 1